MLSKCIWCGKSLSDSTEQLPIMELDTDAFIHFLCLKEAILLIKKIRLNE